MSNEVNPNIERISFEEIQEFKDLDLFHLVPENNEYLVVLLAYDAVTKKFGTALLDTNPESGLDIVVNNNSSLTSDIIVETDLMSVPEGYIFTAGTDLTEVMQLLANPPVEPIVTLNTPFDLYEVNVAQNIPLSYVYTQNAGGTLDVGSLAYYNGVTGIGNPYPITFTQAGPVNLNLLIDMDASTYYTARKLKGEKIIKAVYPIFNGVTGNNAETVILDTPLLRDLDSGEVILDTDNMVVTNTAYYWFAIHRSLDPVQWVTMDRGHESIMNGGPIDSLFTLADSITYKNNIYNVYMTDHETVFSDKLKIKF
jgi:hypothetical protein